MNMDHSEIIDNLRNEIKELSLKNEYLSNLNHSQKAKFQLDMKRQTDLHATDVYALQKCKEKLKAEKTVSSELHKALQADKLEYQNSIAKYELETKRLEDIIKAEKVKNSEFEKELSDKKKEYDNSCMKIDMIHEAFIKLEAEVKANEAATVTAFSEEKVKIEEKMRFDAYEEDTKKSLDDKIFDSAKSDNDSTINSQWNLPDEERQMYENKLNFLQQNLEKYEKYCIGIPNNFMHNSQLYSERNNSETVQDMNNENLMLNALVQRQTKENINSTEKLFAASKQIHELMAKNTASKMEIESSKFKVSTLTDDLNQEKKKVKRLIGLLNEKRTWVKMEQNKRQELMKLLQKKDRKIVEWTKKCNSLETDVTQLMNELRKIEDVKEEKNDIV